MYVNMISYIPEGPVGLIIVYVNHNFLLNNNFLCIAYVDMISYIPEGPVGLPSHKDSLKGTCSYCESTVVAYLYNNFLSKWKGTCSYRELIVVA